LETAKGTGSAAVQGVRQSSLAIHTGQSIFAYPARKPVEFWRVFWRGFCLRKTLWLKVLRL
jgi:hypothetical protein